MTTVRKLAAMAGVSIGTVSLALRDHPRISVATRRRIQALAAEYHYTPHRPSERQNGEKTRTVGCILPNITCTFYARLLRGVLEHAFATDYQTITLETHSNMLRTCKAIDALLSRRVDGILIASGHQAMIPRETVQAMLRQQAWPVGMDSTHFEEAVDEVRSDEHELASCIVEYLVALGHRSIAFLGDIANDGYTRRAQAMSQAFRRHGLPVNLFIDAFVDDPALFDAGSLVQSLLSRSTPPTAIICWEDRAAAMVMQELLRHGLRIPQDISVVGCANQEITNLTTPQLTSVEQHPEEIGRQALNLIINRAGAGETPPSALTIPVRLVKRESCGPCYPSVRR